MNKKIIIIISCLLLVGLGIGGFFMLKGDNEQQPVDVPEPDVNEPEQVVTLENNSGTNEIVVNGITFKDVVIVVDEEKKQLEFTIESETPFENMIIEAVLLNDQNINKRIRLRYDEEVYSQFIIMDFTDGYNNPGQVYFDVVKES